MATHYVAYFTPPSGLFKIAVCGKTIGMADHSVEPTCPKCAAYVDADAKEAAALAAQWDEEDAAKRLAIANRKSA